MKKSILASGVFLTTKVVDRLWQYHLRTREELILLFGNDDFYRSYNEVAYEEALSYDARSPRFREKLFRWERDAIEEFFQSPPARVLVGGAGGGREAFELCARGYQVTAFEPVTHLAMGMYEKAIEQNLELIVFTGGYEQLIQGWGNDASSSRMPPNLKASTLGIFDAILLGWGSVSHVRSPRGRQSLFAKCSEILAPGGRLLASYFTSQKKPVERHLSMKKKILDKTKTMLRNIGGNDDNDRFYAHAGLGHHFDDDEILELAKHSGLKILSMLNGDDDEYPHCLMEKPL
ncbi:MAG: class I SAM-dependent methyltransferase [Deltaproteobacteria bacterium]|nr:class I SAM-dependent methyltransferase [Deltaproteobacteria bacterium]